jgi:hypothetical protein
MHTSLLLLINQTQEIVHGIDFMAENNFPAGNLKVNK